MFFLNLTAGEFLLLFGALAGVVTALYLFDRSKTKKVVSSLRFWAVDLVSTQRTSRKRIREPWSFVLQLLSILLLLLAIGQLEWGRGSHRNRKVVLLVDTSAWSSEVVNGQTVLDAEKKIAAQYLKRLPTNDRVLLAGVDASAVPATVFTSNRAELLGGIAKLQSSYAALDIHRALSFAQQAEATAASNGGEVVYIGPGRIGRGTNSALAVQHLRTIPVPLEGENCGIRSIGLRRDRYDPARWNVVVSVENYGKQTHTLQMTSRLSGRVVDSRLLTIGSQDRMTTEYSFVEAPGGPLAVGIEPEDALRADDRAVITVPRTSKMRLAVFTRRPATMKPLIEADENLEASFSSPEQYTPAPPNADAILLDQFSPDALPQRPALWITPPRDRSPIPVAEVIDDVVLNASDPRADLHAQIQNRRDIRLKNAEVFSAVDGDSVFASTASGPVAVGHQAHSSKFAALGFDPLAGALRFESATPVLFADLLRWLSPQSIAAPVVTTAFAGEATTALSLERASRVLSVADANGAAVPFSVHGQLLQFSTNAPSQIHIRFDDGGSLSVPVLADVAEGVWVPPGDSSNGMPKGFAGLPSDVDLWRWLAFFGGIGFLADWFLFGRGRTAETGRHVEPLAKEEEGELVHR